MSVLKSVYTRVIEGLDPSPLIQKHLLKWRSENGKEMTVVGFGKAVYKMAVAIEGSTDWNISRDSVISVPTCQGEDPPLSRIRVMKGARDNLPDMDSLRATQEIIHVLSSLNEGSTLVILVSGGGSACCTGVDPPLTLEEKSSLIQSLSLSGASINEINTVRKRLSTVKGGKLISHIPKSVSCVKVFVLSDVLGDPLEIIASGPTTPCTDDPSAALRILEKYKAPLSPELLFVLNREVVRETPNNFLRRVEHIWVGNLGMALALAHDIISKELNWSVIKLSSSIQGEASLIGRKFGELALQILRRDEGHIPKELRPEENDAGLGPQEILTKGGALCFIGGGETVVSMDPGLRLGKGGRNQELVLSFTEVMSNNRDVLRASPYKIEFLSCGTDGIDGPTDAAGAVFTEDLLAEDTIIQDFLRRHDSYGYFSSVNGAQNHVKIGHTGTNVLDIQILKISC